VIWQKILAVPSPAEAPHIDPSQFRVTPKPLPKELQEARNAGFLKKIALFFAPVDDTAERRARRTAVNDAQRRRSEMEQRWRREAGDGVFKEKLRKLVQLKSQYESLDAEYAQEKQKLQATIRERQLLKFLDSFFIDDHRISNIGPGRKATLASFGIETALDIDSRMVRKIKGFGASLTGELVRWRKSLENRFVFDPSKGIDPADMAALTQKLRQRKTQIESALLAGPELLNQVKAEAMRKRQVLRVEVEATARALAQAQSDMSVFG
jgi:DNA-binding helix-hairpin-helix protein with protein kinase domain